MMCSPKVALACRLGYASIGVLIGLSVGAVFIVAFNNPPAAYWGLVSGVFATLTLLLFIYLYVVKEVRRQPPSGKILIFVGIFSSLGIGAGVGGLSVYLGLGIIHTLEGDDRPLFQTEYIVCVWSFMTVKWAATSYVYTIRAVGHRVRKLAYSESEEGEGDEEEEEGSAGVTYSQLREQEEPSFVTGDSAHSDVTLIKEKDSSPFEDEPAVDTQLDALL